MYWIYTRDFFYENENQILTLNNIINNVNDNGLIVIEDTSASYSKKHFNPSKYSFINYSKFLIDDLYGRDEEKFNLYGVIKQKSLNKHIYSIKFFNSIVAFFIDRKNCINKKNVLNRELTSKPSEVILDNFKNPRWSSEMYTSGYINKIFFKFSKIFFFLKKIDFIKKIAKKIKIRIITIRQNKKLKKYFE